MKSPLPLLALLAVILISCEKQYPNNSGSGSGYSYSFPNLDDLVGTVWVITRYDVVASSTSFFPNDTLYFQTTDLYRINSGALREYSLRENHTSRLSFDLYDCTVLGGNYWAYVDLSSIIDGEINNADFTESPGDNDLIVWMEEI